MTRPPEATMDKPPSPSGSAPGHFQQRLGLFDSTMLVVGTMIGSGIFVVSVSIAQDVGSAGWLMAVWGLAGFMTIIGALSYAELAGMMPHAGGQYVYLREAYSPLWGFLYGWSCFLVIQTGSIAAVAVVFAKYLGVLRPELGTDAEVNKIWTVENVDIRLTLPFMKEPFFIMKDFVVTTGQLVAAGIIVFLTLLNCRGVQEGKVVQNIFTVAKTLALILLIIVGVFVVASTAAWSANSADWWGGINQTDRFRDVSKLELVGSSRLLVALMVAGGAMVGALFAADAWNNITFTAGEIRNPRRNLPLSLALGTGTVIVLYLLANFAYLRALPVMGDPALERKVTALEARENKLRDEKKDHEAKAAAEEKKEILNAASTFERGIALAKDQRVGTAVLELWSPRLGAGLMALAIMVSTFGCVNGMILMGARLYYVMAQDQLFFRAVGGLNKKLVPAVGLVLQGLWSILLVFSGTYDELLDFVIFAVLVFYVLTVAGLFILRRTQPQADRPYRAVGYPFLPAVYVILCAVIMLNLLVVKPKFTWPGLIIVLTGIPVYFIWRFIYGPEKA
jgi:APA family basic amino acid/polyamine antiporter